MSLKAIHITFILLSISLAAWLGVWGIRDYLETANTFNLVLGLGSILGCGGLLFYLTHFIKKMRDVPAA